MRLHFQVGFLDMTVNQRNESKVIKSDYKILAHTKLLSNFYSARNRLPARHELLRENQAFIALMGPYVAVLARICFPYNRKSATKAIMKY
jgi:hypothetical protein